MKCPHCGAAELVRDTRDMLYSYQGESTIIPAVTGDYCPECSESVLDAAEAARVSAAGIEFNKQVNAATIDPSFIVKVRQRFGIDQRQAAGIFGGGHNAFSRYETGKARPPVSLVKLLKLLDRHPDLFDEVRAA